MLAKTIKMVNKWFNNARKAVRKRPLELEKNENPNYVSEIITCSQLEDKKIYVMNLQALES